MEELETGVCHILGQQTHQAIPIAAHRSYTIADEIFQPLKYTLHREAMASTERENRALCAACLGATTGSRVTMCRQRCARVSRVAAVHGAAAAGAATQRAVPPGRPLQTPPHRCPTAAPQARSASLATASSSSPSARCWRSATGWSCRCAPARRRAWPQFAAASALRLQQTRAVTTCKPQSCCATPGPAHRTATPAHRTHAGPRTLALAPLLRSRPLLARAPRRRRMGAADRSRPRRAVTRRCACTRALEGR